MNSDKTFELKLEAIKKQKVDFTFYPYSSITNIEHLNNLLEPIGENLKETIKGKRILDIGAADGDMSFLAEHWGAKSITAIEYAPTNYNGVKGIKYIKSKLRSKLKIVEYDIDNGSWPKLPKADFAFLLGILYHLKNPIFVLENLAKASKYAVFSSRVFDVIKTGWKTTNLANQQLAYLWKPAEVNNDTTNWWCYTNKSLELMVERSGWEIIATKRVDSKVDRAEVSGMANDGRYFIYAKSKLL